MHVLRRARDLKAGDIIDHHGYPADLITVQSCGAGCCVLLRWGDGPEWAVADAHMIIRVVPAEAVKAETWTPRPQA